MSELLDHSSLESLLAGLDRGGVFRFVFRSGSGGSPWHPDRAGIVPGRPDILRLRIRMDGWLRLFDFWTTRDDWLWSPLHNSSLRVVVQEEPLRGSNPDDHLRIQLDDNLRRAFA